jgi:hypothetical protein
MYMGQVMLYLLAIRPRNIGITYMRKKLRNAYVVFKYMTRSKDNGIIS